MPSERQVSRVQALAAAVTDAMSKANQIVLADSDKRLVTYIYDERYGKEFEVES